MRRPHDEDGSNHLAMRCFKYILGRKPTMTIVFALVAYGIGNLVFLHFIHSSRTENSGGEAGIARREDRSSKPWRKPISTSAGRIFAPAVVFTDARFRGRLVPLHENVSDMTHGGYFRDVSSIKVSKGTTVLLYSEKNWKGRELLIDADASFLGLDMNDRVYSVAVKDEEPLPHAVEIYRVGSSMGVSQGECPASTMCWPATTMPEVRSSVYMGSSRSLYDEVGRRIGCEVVKFVSAEGRRLYGVLPEKVYVMCVGEQWVWPAEPSGHEIKVNVASLGHRLSLVSASLLPRVFTARELFNATECKQLIAAAVSGAKGGADPLTFRPDENAVIGDAVKRASELVKLPEELATDVVFRRYRDGEGLEAHVDAVDPRRDPKYVGSNNRNRFATVLVYLSAVTREQGGETIFNRGRGGDAGDGCGRGLRVSPGLGGAMVFYSLLADGQQQGIIDKFSHHGACKLRSGEKWVVSFMYNNKLSRLEELAKEKKLRESKRHGRHEEP